MSQWHTTMSCWNHVMTFSSAVAFMTLFFSFSQAVMNELNAYSFFLRTFVSAYMQSLGVELFMTRTVHEVLWGFKDPLLTKLHSLKPEVDEYFGLMWKVRVSVFVFFKASLARLFRGLKKKNFFFFFKCHCWSLGITKVVKSEASVT